MFTKRTPDTNDLMNKKWIIASGLFLLLLQFISYTSMGNRALTIDVHRNRISLATEKSDVLILNTIPPTGSYLRAELSDLFSNTFEKIIFADSILTSEFDNKSSCIYGFEITYQLPFYRQIDDYNTYKIIGQPDTYVEAFRAEYIWLLCGWVQLKQSNIGQS